MEEIWLREEQRTHTQIIGTTGEGKSKCLEYPIREDIRRGNGLTFGDPSDGGQTLYDILRYCAKIDYKKVLLIDPLHHYTHNVICPINPLSGFKDDAVAKTMDTFRVLYGQRDWSDTPIIRRYLKAILSVLHNAGLPLSDAVYFTEPGYIVQRKKISHTPEDDRQRMAIEQAFKHQRLFIEFQSTVRRLEEFFHPTLQLMFGWRQGIDFTRLIADGWVIWSICMLNGALNKFTPDFLGRR